MSFDPLTAIFDIGKTVLNKILPDKMSDAEKAQVEAAFQAEASKAMLTQNKDFRDFVLEYEGRAKDIPRGLVWIRSAIRPAFTILIGYMDYLGQRLMIPTGGFQSVIVVKDRGFVGTNHGEIGRAHV